VTWTTVSNGINMQADDIDGDLRHIAEGNRLPRSGNNMAATNAVHDVGTLSKQFRDGHLTRDMHTKNIRSQANFSGYMQWSSYPFNSAFASQTSNSGPAIVVPPFKAEINGQICVHAATTTLDFATTTSWVSGQNNMTASTFVWVYAVPTTTGDAVVLLDDVDPVHTFNTTTSGLYHPSQTTYRAIHTMRVDSNTSIIRYLRSGNDVNYFRNTGLLEQNNISQTSWGTVRSWTSVPNFPERTERMYLNLFFDADTQPGENGRFSVFYTNNTAHSIGAILTLTPYADPISTTVAESVMILPSGNSSYFRWLIVGGGLTGDSVTAEITGYRLRY